MNIDGPISQILRMLTILMVWLSLAMPAFSQDAADQPARTEAGHIVMGSGRLIARTADGVERRLRRRSPIYVGDTIVVGENAFIQVRFSDGGLLSLRPGSEFRVAEYRYQEQEEENGKAVFELLKGGLRTITGSVGKKKKQNYQVNTPISTIGIRGTHYGVRLCAGDCQTPDGELMADGLYGGAIDGAISVRNQSEEKVFSNDRHFHVAGIDAPIQELLGPSGIVFDHFDVTVTAVDEEASAQAEGEAIDSEQAELGDFTIGGQEFW